MLKRCFLFFYVFLVIFLMVLSLEGFIRLCDNKRNNICPLYMTLPFHPYYRVPSIPGLVYEMNPNTSLPDYAPGNVLTTNSLGFRDRDYAIPKPEKTFGIVGLGDSMSFGLDVAAEETFLSLLEERLNEESADPDMCYEAVNCSVPGYNMAQYYINLREKAMAYDPDLVICSVWGDDFSRTYFPLVVKNNSLRKIHHWLIDRSWLWRFLYYKFRIERDYDVESVASSRAAGIEALLGMLDMLKEKGIPVLFLLQAMNFADEVENCYELYETLFAVFEERGIPYVNMESHYPDYLGGRKLISLSIAPDIGDSHPNAEGNRVIANVLVDYLLGSTILGKDLE